MPPDYKFFTPTELPIVGEKFSFVKCQNGRGETEFKDAEVIAYFPKTDMSVSSIIIKAHLGKTFVWEIYIFENNLHTWKFRY